jgi:UDP-glucose 4-epimerase
VLCEHGSVANVALVQDTIERHQIAAVIHFAGFKAVGESVEQPLKYFENNVGGMMALLRAMQGYIGAYRKWNGYTYAGEADGQ